MEEKDYLEAAYYDIPFDLTKEEDCLRLEEQNRNLTLEEQPKFSFMMSIYNDIQLLNAAVNSLLKQSFHNWELVIWDDSDHNDDVWEMVQRLVKADQRIHAYHGEKRVGWPKAVSLCLSHIRGEYTTFLAADDCIKAEVLQRLNEILCREEPDILWVGNDHVEYTPQTGPESRGMFVPEYRVYTQEQRSTAIVHIMRHVYYNSMFHYMKTSFLRENQIDFFEPYYMDCAGMTQAMAAANKMIAWNEVVYYLTLNTSQTAGRYTWDSYDFMFSNQWRSVKQVFIREGFMQKEDIGYVAARIARNLFGNVGLLCRGQCRDKYMAPLQKETKEVIAQIEALLSNKEIIEMLEITANHGFTWLLEALAGLQEYAGIEKILERQSWLNALIVLAVQGEALEKEQKIELISDWILEENNHSCIGFEYFALLVGSAADSVVIQQRKAIEAVIGKYNHYLEEQEKETDDWRRFLVSIR